MMEFGGLRLKTDRLGRFFRGPGTRKGWPCYSRADWPAGVRFAEHLAAHAQTEEEITYPTALLIGLYVKSKATQCAR